MRSDCPPSTGSLPAESLNTIGYLARRRRILAEPQRMEHFVNDRGLDFTSVPAPGTHEIASAYIDDAAALGGERKYSVSFARRSSCAIQKQHHSKVARRIGLQLTQPRGQRQISFVLELQEEGSAFRLRQPFRRSPDRASRRVARVCVLDVDVGPVAIGKRLSCRRWVRTRGRRRRWTASNSRRHTLSRGDEMTASQQ